MHTEKYADSMAFPVTQSDFVRHYTSGVDPEIGMLLGVSHVTAAPPAGSFLEMQKAMEAILQTQKALLNSSQKPHFVYTRGDMDKPGKKIVLGLQCPPKNADAETLMEAGICIMNPGGYSEPTEFGSGFANQKGHLTKKGVDLVRECARLGMIVDLSHCSHRTARDILTLIRDERLPVPVMASHGGCHAVYPHPRNLPDDVLEGVAERGGVVGIVTMTFFLHEKDNTLVPFGRHVQHALDVCGKDAVCVGSDSIYRNLSDKENWENLEFLGDLLVGDKKDDPFQVRYPERSPELIAQGEFTMELLERRLVMDGVEESVIDKVVGDNFYQFLKHSLPE
jgi:microsomal dipeptidase-like Zn-dependent dipeptidase